ncbi:hypothetical protein [Pedobacter insulae]|uniref:O-antigen ligase like membrane protein n=1 Tax=Pedobacter insulae TaxID=414048 RepID=A0A1I2TEV3_9SPHI|nr:hypothetical protein [Pedobacter insulae]SFG62629.1 hypothetical protein SAMN04489864_101324 [Pedobacter insulae]
MRNKVILLRYLLLAQLVYIVAVYGFSPIINNAIGTEGTVYFVRPISYFLDLLFIVFFIKRDQRGKSSLRFLLFLLIPSLLIGIMFNSFSSRHITDLLFPLIFLFKISATLDVLKVREYRAEFLIFVKKLAVASLISSLLMLFVFYFVSYNKLNYLGLTPLIQPYFVTSLQNSNLIGTLGALAIAFFSGKRAIMLGSIVVFFFYLVFNITRLTKKFILGAGITVFIGINFLIFLSDSTAFLKLNRTIESLTSDDQEVISSVFSSRSSEIEGIMDEMSGMDYVFGKGIGSTFKFQNDSFQLYNKEALGNAHFSPLTLVFKYGIIFAVCFYLLMFRGIMQLRSRDKVVQFSALFILAVIVEYLFSYGLFIDRYLPMAIAVVLFAKINRGTINA